MCTNKISYGGRNYGRIDGLDEIASRCHLDPTCEAFEYSGYGDGYGYMCSTTAEKPSPMYPWNICLFTGAVIYLIGV